MDAWTDAQRDQFDHGAALFDAGEWFEAHEVWESLWKTLSGPDKERVQGLIQLAVALEHDRRGNAVGAQRTLDRARPRLAGSAALIARVEAWLRDHRERPSLTRS